MHINCLHRTLALSKAPSDWLNILSHHAWTDCMLNMTYCSSSSPLRYSPIYKYRYKCFPTCKYASCWCDSIPACFTHHQPSAAAEWGSISSRLGPALFTPVTEAFGCLWSQKNAAASPLYGLLGIFQILNVDIPKFYFPLYTQNGKFMQNVFSCEQKHHLGAV